MTKTMQKRVHTKPDGRTLNLYGWQPHDLPVTEELEPVGPPTPQMRWNALRGEWVAYTAHRQNRTFKPPAEYCPLCPVKKGGFPGEIPFEDFELVVFDNRFPGLALNPPAPEGDFPVPTEGAVGHCEVVVFSSAHSGSLASLAPERRELLVRAWADRYRDLLAKEKIAFVMPFENRGEEIGVTLHHPHGQIYAFSFMPPVVEKMVAAFRKAPVIQELRQAAGDRYDVGANETAVAFVPPFARFPSEVWVTTRKAHPGPWTFSDAEVRDFAALLGETVARYDGLFGKPMPYLMILYAAPKGEEGHFQFHAQFLPFLRTADRLKYLAGCEQGAGTFLVDSLPEQMVERLREVKL